MQNLSLPNVFLLHTGSACSRRMSASEPFTQVNLIHKGPSRLVAGKHVLLVDLELIEHRFGFRILLAFPQVKHLGLPPVPGFDLDQLIQNSFAHESNEIFLEIRFMSTIVN